MAPKRTSTSPAPARKTPTKATPEPKAKSPAKPSPAGRPSKSPARTASKKDAAAPSASPPPAAAAAPPKNGNGKAAAAPAGSPPSDNTMALIAVVLGVLVLITAAAVLPLEKTLPQKVPALSAKSFNGKDLKQSSGYAGSALVAFTDNATFCEPCNELSTLLTSDAFMSQHGKWWSAQMLRVGKVNCNVNEDLCARFGVGDGVSTEKGDDTPGLPYIVWFKGGKEAGPYTGERTLAGLTAWVGEKQAAKEL